MLFVFQFDTQETVDTVSLRHFHAHIADGLACVNVHIVGGQSRCFVHSITALGFRVVSLKHGSFETICEPKLDARQGLLVLIGLEVDFVQLWLSTTVQFTELTVGCSFLLKLQLRISERDLIRELRCPIAEARSVSGCHIKAYISDGTWIAVIDAAFQSDDCLPKWNVLEDPGPHFALCGEISANYLALGCKEADASDALGKLSGRVMPCKLYANAHNG